MAENGGQSRRNSPFAWLLGAAVGTFAWLTGNALEIPPELWEDISVAAGLRPPPDEFPLWWQNALSFFIAEFGISPCLEALRILGPVSLGMLTVLAFRVFSDCIPEVMRTDMRRTRRGRLTVDLVLAQGALFFSCSEPVWLAGRVFSPEMANLLLLVLAFRLSLAAVDRSALACMIAAGAVSGALFAETPLALAPVALCVLSLRRKCGDPVAVPSPIANPLVFTVAARRMALVFIFSWIGMIVVNLDFFRGSGVGDENVFMSVVKYLLNYPAVIMAAASPTGILLIATVILLPLVITGAKMRELSDTGRLLPLPYACFAAVVGTLAALQSTGCRGCRFWDWDPGAVSSAFALCVCVFASSVTAVKVLGVFAVDVFFRNHSRLLREAFPDAAEDEPLAARLLRSLRRSAVWLRIPARFEPILALALVVPFRSGSPVREMSSIVNGIADQTAAECSGAGMVFTDGSFDAAVEVAAARRGDRLKAVSMMAGSGEYDVALRLRGETDVEARELLEAGAANALREWVHGGHSRASNIAVQVGLELWRNSGTHAPVLGGLVARTAGFRDGDADRWAQSARVLAGRIIDFCAENDPEKTGCPELGRMFRFGQWRLSRMCRMRAGKAESDGNVKKAEAEHGLADKLDAGNPQWREVRDRMLALRMQGDARLTPREGLELALKRADFRMAKPFAERILSADPGDMQANFAMAMGCFAVKRYVQAETHLKKCLARCPEEPAVLNNLAVVQLRLGKIDQAETNALKALELHGDSSEVKATLRHIRAAKKDM